MSQEKLSFKDKMDLLEAICTIIVSVGALWGGFVVWESKAVHKMKHIIDYYHEKIIQEEQEK